MRKNGNLMNGNVELGNVTIPPCNQLAWNVNFNAPAKSSILDYRFYLISFADVHCAAWKSVLIEGNDISIQKHCTECDLEVNSQ